MAFTTAGTTTETRARVANERGPRAAVRCDGGVPCRMETMTGEMGGLPLSTEGRAPAVVEVAEVGGATAAAAVSSEPAAHAFAPSADSGSHTTREFRASRNGARTAVWRWFARARRTTRRLKSAALTSMRRTERRASSCQAEIEPGPWAMVL